MSNLLKLLIASAFVVAVAGCGTPKSETMDAANLPEPTPTPAGQQPGKAAPGMIDDFSVNPAPPGVQTGTPGEGGK